MEEGSIVRWETPFVSAGDYGVRHLADPIRHDVVHVVVDTTGPERYPKHIVTFDPVIGLRTTDETYDVRTLPFARDAESARSHEWLESAWKRSVSEGLAEAHFGKPLRHFVIYGAEMGIEVLTVNEPEIEPVYGPRILWLHAV